MLTGQCIKRWKKKTLYFNVDSASSTLVRKHVYEDNVKQAEQEGRELDLLKSGQGRNHCCCMRKKQDTKDTPSGHSVNITSMSAHKLSQY